MLFSTYAQTLNGQHPAVTLGHVTTLRGPFLVSRTGNDDPSLPPRRVHVQNASVCTFKTFPCVPAASPHVSYMWAWCRYTRGRFECTHGGVLNVYTGFFHVFFTVPQHTKHTPRPQRHTPHNTTRRQKQKETEKERQDKKREDETRQ